MHFLTPLEGRLDLVTIRRGSILLVSSQPPDQTGSWEPGPGFIFGSWYELGVKAVIPPGDFISSGLT